MGYINNGMNDKVNFLVDKSEHTDITNAIPANVGLFSMSTCIPDIV